MASTVISIKTDRGVKEEAQKIAKEMGFPLSTLINAFMRQFIKNKTVYFTTMPTENIGEAMGKELEKIEKDIKKGLNLSPKFERMEDALNFLKKT